MTGTPATFELIQPFLIGIIPLRQLAFIEVVRRIGIAQIGIAQDVFLRLVMSPGGRIGLFCIFFILCHRIFDGNRRKLRAGRPVASGLRPVGQNNHTHLCH